MKRETMSVKGVLPVDVTLLDRLMRLAGELVLSRNQLLQGIGESSMKAIEVSGHRIDLIISELQETVMKTRMQPAAMLFDTLKGMEGDLGRKYGKDLAIGVEGERVELDTTVLDSIREPLQVLIEYCAKYGIETPEIRKQAGKAVQGNILIKAFKEAGHINIAVCDDGCGSLSESIPDFALKQIEIIGGRIETDAVPDRGSEIRIKLPLTLAIIPSQIASVGKETYVIPQANLEELIRIPSDQIKEKIVKVGSADVVRLRGDLLPVLNLSDIFGIERSYKDPYTGEEKTERRRNVSDRRAEKFSENGEPFSNRNGAPEHNWQKRDFQDRRQQSSNAVNIAVVYAGSYRYGMVIDRLHDSEEIVVKPLGQHFRRHKAYAGATILGNGKVALILDILNLATIAGLSARRESELSPQSSESGPSSFGMESVVVFKNQETEHFALPFDSVERIERVQSSDIEEVGTRKVVQYRGGALPLYELSGMMSIDPLSKRRVQEVIVLKENGREFGLLVAPPVDTFETELVLDRGTMK